MRKLIAVFSLVVTLVGCVQKVENSNQVEYQSKQVLEDSLFNRYFLPRGEGYTGGDGTYSVLLPDGRTIWIWGDTFLGNVTEDNRRIKTDPLYIRNCFTIIKNDTTLETIHQGDPSEWKSMMIPPEVEDGSSGKNERELWYWPGDGFVEDNTLKVFLSKFAQVGEGMWGFEWQETELFEFSLPDFDILKIRRFTDQDGAHFGHAVCPTEEYTYIYGLKGQFPHVARVEAGSLENWEYYTGSDWSDDPEEARPMIEFSGSEQFSVFQWKNKFILITQEGGFGTCIYSFVSDTPYGPWSNKKKLYDTPLPNGEHQLFTYNALAHPQFIEDGMLLVSYNTNSMELQDHYQDALIYRPRFIRVPLDLILN